MKGQNTSPQAAYLLGDGLSDGSILEVCAWTTELT